MVHPIHLPLPVVSPCSFRYVLPFVSTLTYGLFTSSFFQVVHFVASVLLQLLHLVCLPVPFVSSRRFRYCFPFVFSLRSGSFTISFPFSTSISLRPSFRCKTLPFHWLLPCFRFNSSSRSLLLPFRFNSSLLFPMRRFFRFKVLNIKLFSSVRYFLPIVLTLPSTSCTSSFHFKAFISLLPSVVSTLTCGSLTSSFHFMSFISLPPSFRFNSSFLFVLFFLSFQLVHFPASVLSLHPFPSIRYFLSFQNFPRVRLPLLFVSSGSFHFIIPSVSTRTSRVIADLKKLEWLQVASFLNFNYRAFCNNVTVSNPGLVRLPP